MTQPVIETNVPPIPPVKRARLPWYRSIVHTIRIWYMLRLQNLKLAILSWLGVDQLLQNEANARKANDATALGLIQRHANQVNQIARTLPSLVAARKRVEFYEQPSEYLNHAKRRYDKAHPKLTLEKSNGTTEANRQAQRHGSRAGAGGEVPESPRPDAAREDGKAGVQRATDDGTVEGRGEVQIDPATRKQVIEEIMDNDEASANMGHRIPTDDDERHEYEPGSGNKCRLCGLSENNILHRPPNPLISDPNDRG